MRILFSPAHLGQYFTWQSLSNMPITSVPAQVVGDLRVESDSVFSSSINPGNVVHVESLSRILDFDKANSAYTDWGYLNKLSEASVLRFADEVSRKFDYVIISEANLLRHFDANKELSEKVSSDWKSLALFLDSIKIPFAVFGVGCQNLSELPNNPEDFDSNLLEYLTVLSKKATLVTLRGYKTAFYIKSVLKLSGNFIVTGCPSMFAYPKNIFDIRFKFQGGGDKVLSAGYLHPYNIAWRYQDKIKPLMDIARLFQSDYVFQDDLWKLFHESAIDYNQATGELDYSQIKNRLSECWINKQGDRFESNSLLFQKYLYYTNIAAWRIRCSTYDFYLGDRLHGGIVAMQAGVPAVFLYDDDRLSELIDFFKLPAIELNKIMSNDLLDLIEKSYTQHAIEQLKDNYSKVLGEFRYNMKNSDLKILI